jgi:hypothetical protein
LFKSNGDLSLGASGSQFQKPLLDGLGSRVDLSPIRIALRKTDEDVMFLVCPVDANSCLVRSALLTARLGSPWSRASIQARFGHTTASVALQRLVSSTAKNHFYRAKRDLGRIFKTEFMLSYLSEPKLRARIRRGLLKVEQLLARARDIYYGRRGRINARELHEQMNSCSCLTLLLACVVYWQAKEIARVLKMGFPEGEDINISLLEHVSPIEWENVILYGQYVLNPDDIR